MDINYEAETKGYLDITFGPKWDYIALTRPYVENFLLINMATKTISIRSEPLHRNFWKMPPNIPPRTGSG